jgi:hypothetical protein
VSRIYIFVVAAGVSLTVVEKVFGGADPNSGSASVHEIVAGLGKLLEKGWKPLRTIIIASWDAEEVGSFLNCLFRSTRLTRPDSMA